MTAPSGHALRAHCHGYGCTSPRSHDHNPKRPHTAQILGRATSVWPQSRLYSCATLATAAARSRMPATSRIRSGSTTGGSSRRTCPTIHRPGGVRARHGATDSEVIPIAGRTLNRLGCAIRHHAGRPGHNAQDGRLSGLAPGAGTRRVQLHLAIGAFPTHPVVHRQFHATPPWRPYTTRAGGCSLGPFHVPDRPPAGACCTGLRIRSALRVSGTRPSFRQVREVTRPIAGGTTPATAPQDVFISRPGFSVPRDGRSVHSGAPGSGSWQRTAGRTGR